MTAALFSHATAPHVATLRGTTAVTFLGSGMGTPDWDEIDDSEAEAEL